MERERREQRKDSETGTQRQKEIPAQRETQRQRNKDLFQIIGLCDYGGWQSELYKADKQAGNEGEG